LPVTLTRPSVRSTDFPTTEYSSILIHSLLKDTVNRVRASCPQTHLPFRLEHYLLNFDF
jgi:hypothetical protein